MMNKNNIGKEYLQRFGWRPGQGLGKEEDGVKTFVHVQKRAVDCSTGVGLRAFQEDCKLWDAQYWANLYDSAAKGFGKEDKGNVVEEKQSVYGNAFVKSVEEDDTHKELRVVPALCDFTRILFKDRSRGKLKRAQLQEDKFSKRVKKRKSGHVDGTTKKKKSRSKSKRGKSEKKSKSKSSKHPK